MIRPDLFEDTETAFRQMSDADMRRANLVFSIINHPWVSATAIFLLRWSMKLRLPVRGLVRATIFRQFCGGETITESESTIDRMGAYRVRTILDYAVEGENSEADFDATCEAVLETVEEALKSAHVPLCVFKVTGLGDAALLAKKQSGVALSDDELRAFDRIAMRVERICKRAHDAGIPVLIDAEETWIQEPIDELAKQMMMRFNRSRALVFTTIQMYRKVGLERLQEIQKHGEANGYLPGIKLVRGAYMEKERNRAREMGYPDPIQPDKASTDHAFDEGLRFCIAQAGRISLVCGSHNEKSNLLLAQLLSEAGFSKDDARIWFSQLLGMSDHISFNLAKEGYNVVKYVPYGPMETFVPYLTRRAEENTSVAGQSSRELQLIRRELRRRKAARV